MQRINEAGNNPLFVVEGKITVHRLLRITITQQIERIHVVAVPRQCRRQRGPVTGTRAQTMYQHDGPVHTITGRHGLEIVNAMAGDGHLVLMNVILLKVQTSYALNDPERVVDRVGNQPNRAYRHRGEDDAEPLSDARSQRSGLPNSSENTVCAKPKRPPWYLSGPFKWPMAKRDTAQ